MVTFGIEEEFLLVNPDSEMPSSRAGEVITALIPGDGVSLTSSAEFLACQVESSTPICSDRDAALTSLLDFRGRLQDAAAAAGLAVAPTGAAPLVEASPAVVSGTERYQDMGAMAGAVADEHYVNGTHVHVAIPSREEGVQVLNRLRPWLATLGAISANSPYWHGRDTLFASWRLVQYRRWSVQGCPPYFQSSADYDARVAKLMATDIVLDSGHVGWIARLSNRFPTIEIRVADTQLEARDAVLLALVARGLVSTALSEETASVDGGPDTLADPEILDAGLWQAARFGLRGNLLDHGPNGGDLSRAAPAQVGALLDYIRPALEESGDDSFVRAGVAHVLSAGTGSQRQREAVRHGGFAALRPLFATSLTAS
ncbi:glutamate--cysteine ligase [Arthrobacter sp. 08Y14]|uniref:carboxylate-amine ligase n=1 Tax=Arthrobacter sp. 08Y14 TaxID=2058885 RepID=UPI0015E38C29|nr:glutamate--cysteine ligase [Arthrobacter sp. 08Y14]